MYDRYGFHSVFQVRFKVVVFISFFLVLVCLDYFPGNIYITMLNNIYWSFEGRAR